MYLCAADTTEVDQRKGGAVTYRDESEARAVAVAYAWGAQDALGGAAQDSGKAEAFARSYAAAHEAFRTEASFHLPNLRASYVNYLDHGHVYAAEECGQCGRHLRGGHAQCPAAVPVAPGCARCPDPGGADGDHA